MCAKGMTCLRASALLTWNAIVCVDDYVNFFCDEKKSDENNVNSVNIDNISNKTGSTDIAINNKDTSTQEDAIIENNSTIEAWTNLYDSLML